MRISDYRYSRDRSTFDVASRLIDFEARTSTIRELTGLTDDRIRKLSKECGVDGSSTSKQRHRGRSPRSVRYFLSKPHIRNEAAALLSLCQLMGVSRSATLDAQYRSTAVFRAERLCDAYWTFRYLAPEASISFEQMLLLLSETASGGEMTSTHCSDCNALFVVDAFSLYDSLCPHCADRAPLENKPERIQYRRVAEEAPAYS